MAADKEAGHLSVTDAHYADGSLAERTWRLGPAMHNDNGPSYLQYYKSGQEKMRYYTRLGKFHNALGPAIVERWTDGSVHRCVFYINGEEITEEEFLKLSSTKAARS